MKILPTLLLLASTCCAQTPQHTASIQQDTNFPGDECLSKERVRQETDRFLSSVAKGAIPYEMMSSFAAEESKNNGITGEFAASASKHSTEISYVEAAPDESSRKIKHATFPENTCITSFVLSAPEELRKKCDDDGAYGVWYTFSVHNGDIQISDVSGNIYPECSEFR